MTETEIIEDSIAAKNEQKHNDVLGKENKSIAEKKVEENNNVNGKQIGSIAEKEPEKPLDDWRWEIDWYQIVHILFFIFNPFFAIYGLGLYLGNYAQSLTLIYAVTLACLSYALGMSVGVHRLWSHRAFKATWQLRLLLMLAQTITLQESVITWAKNHRVHHKYSDTDADPHNARRGFFFSHIGWLFFKKHPEFHKKVTKIDISDLTSDPILRFQYDYLIPFGGLMVFIIPPFIPWYFWNETVANSMYLGISLRLLISHNITFCINSVAHSDKWGTKPYDKNIKPIDNLWVATALFGEGWHNYHHAFPWDYRASEFNGGIFASATTSFIDLFAKIGWAYDLKTTSDKMIRDRVNRTGDGSHGVWGWGDKDQPKEEIREAIVMYSKSS